MRQRSARKTPLERVVIAGDGLAGWMAAAVLARALPAGRGIRVVSTDPAPPHEPGTADATLPLPDGVHPALDVDEDELVAQTAGAFTLGIALSGFASTGATWFHPFGSVGAALGPIAFPHLAMRLRREGASLKLANFSLAALAAQAGRFARPDANPQSVRSTMQYGLHLDREALTAFHRGLAERAGVRREKRPLERVELGDDGAIRALLLEGGRRAEGDLFLDCTATRRRLVASFDDAPWDDWSAWLPFRRVVSARVATSAAPPPFSHAEAHATGWIRHLPLATAMSLTGYHHPDHLSDDEAVRRLENAAAGDMDCDGIATLDFGRLRSPWRRNCLALGTAAAVIDPVGISDLHLLRTSLDRLLELLPATRDAAAEAAEYNRRSAMHLDNARDFAMLHYKLNGRRGDAAWDACRAMPVPDSLDYKLRLYESRGRVPMYDEEPLDEISWIGLFDEHGIRPRRYNPIADGVAAADVESHLERVRAIMIDEVARMPPHGRYLAEIGASAGRTAEDRA